MRILVLTNVYPNPLYPHRAAHNRQMVAALTAAGHEARVIAPIAWTDELAARRAGAPAMPPGRRSSRDGVVVEHPRYLFVPRFLRARYGDFYRWSVRRAFDRAVEEFRPDVVLACWAYPDGLAGVELGRRAGLPVVVKVHGSDVLLDYGICGGAGASEALRRADGVLAVSKDLARRVVELGADADRVRVVYNGVDATRFNPGPRDAARAKLGLTAGRPIVLFAGNLLRVKGLDVLLDALATVGRSGQPFDCRLVGQGACREELEGRAAALGISDRVHFVGAVRHDELPDWFRAADLFVLPSRSEGVPNVLLEASACGTPYVASRVGGIPEIAHLGDGTLVPPEDAAALAEAIAARLRAPAEPGARQARPMRTPADSARELVELLEDARVRHRAKHGSPDASDPATTTAATNVGVA